MKSDMSHGYPLMIRPYEGVARANLLQSTLSIISIADNPE